MRDLPFDLPGRFWRGNLHTHSDRSGGTLPPAGVIALHREAGYDFVAVTDHLRPGYDCQLTDTRGLRTAGFTTLLGAELSAPASGSGAECHLVAVGLPPGFRPPEAGETGPRLARRARAAGAFVGLAHPVASLLTLADAESLANGDGDGDGDGPADAEGPAAGEGRTAVDAIEVHNGLAAGADRGDAWALLDLLLARGHRLTGYAADDSHFRPGDPPDCAAWVQVRAESLDPEALLAALKAGRYYASTGPEIYAVEICGDEVTICCSPASRIVVSGGVPGVRVLTGDGLTKGQLTLDELGASGYLRVTVVDSSDGRAWTNPIWRC
jgi:hypothetical protein